MHFCVVFLQFITLLLSIVSVCVSFIAVNVGIAVDIVSKHAHIDDFRIRRTIIRNRATDEMKMWCYSRNDSTGERQVNPGESLSFAFNPHLMGGHRELWCTVEYKNFWARWDAFGSYATYGHNNRKDKAYVYEIQNDGIYYRGQKVRGLAAGEYRYTLWENFDQNKMPFGNSLKGYVDSGVCNNVPNFMEGKVSAVTFCDKSCIILYDKLHCHGQTSRLQASSRGCTNFWLSFFNDKARSLKGC